MRLETLNVGAAPDIYELGVRGLAAYWKRYPELDETPFVAARYKFLLRRASIGGRDVHFEWQVRPLGGVVGLDDFGEAKFQLYPQRDGLNAIPDDPDLAYRGMAWEEWQFVRRNGFLQSIGNYNLDQHGLTFCGTARAAEAYASGFAPMAFKPGIERPGIVVAFPRSVVLHHRDLPDKIPEGECAVQGRLDAKALVAVWNLVPTRIRYGRLELHSARETPTRAVEGSRASPIVSYAIIPSRVGSHAIV